MEQLLHSQFFLGGFLLMLSGGAMALARSVPMRIMEWLRDQFSVTLTVLDSDPVFESLVTWLDAQPYSQRTRRLIVSTIRDDDESTRTLFSPGIGNHFLRYKGRSVWLNRSRNNEAPSVQGGSPSRQTVRMETITLTIVGRSQTLLRELLKDASDIVARQREERVAVYIADYGWWRKLRGASKRPFSSVFLPGSQSSALLDDVTWFLTHRKDYAEACVPYRRGYLLHGLPGTGKTSTVMSLASELNLSLYVLPLSSPDMDDQKLFNLMLSVRPGSVILLEDVDAVNLTRITPASQETSDAPAASARLTLSGVLNCLDGVAAQEGCLTFMTTNRIEALDAALIRPGRVDFRLEFDYADNEQIVSAYRRFFPNSNGDGEAFARALPQAIVMADVQEMLMRKRFRPQASVAKA
jgi:mitochondrial chaperone BCS1